MSNINFSNTAPAAAAGHTNVAFAVDGSNDISASIATPLVAANNFSDVPTPATAQANLFGGWQTWTPTLSCNASMTASAPTGVNARYICIGPLVYFTMVFTTTLGGTLSTALFATAPPLLPQVSGGNTPCSGSNQASSVLCSYVAGSKITILNNAAAVWTAGTWTIYVSGFYECA